MRLDDGKPPRLTNETHHPGRMMENIREQKRCPSASVTTNAVYRVTFPTEFSINDRSRSAICTHTFGQYLAYTIEQRRAAMPIVDLGPVHLNRRSHRVRTHKRIRVRFGAAGCAKTYYSSLNIVLPSLIVSVTLMVSSISGSTSVGSSERMTRSASLPTSMDPFSPSSNCW